MSVFCLLFSSLNNFSFLSLPSPLSSLVANCTDSCWQQKISPSTDVLPILHRAHRFLPTSISSWNVYCFCQENTLLTHTQLVIYCRHQILFWKITLSPLAHFLNLCNFLYLARLIAFVPPTCVLCFLESPLPACLQFLTEMNRTGFRFLQDPTW